MECKQKVVQRVLRRIERTCREQSHAAQKHETGCPNESERWMVTGPQSSRCKQNGHDDFRDPSAFAQSADQVQQEDRLPGY
jgi:hypothetical protein